MQKIIKTLIGLALLTMGLVVLSGWLFHLPLMVQFKLGMVPMVFNTALCFAVTGVALALPESNQPWLLRLQTAIGLLLIVFCSFIFVSIVTDHNLGIDWPSLHIWIGDGNTRPGRMAPNTALSFIAIGFALMIIPRVASRSQARAARLLTFVVLGLGTTGLVGYMLAPDLLYGWARSARMAVHTATGMILAGVALWLSWSRADWYSSRRYLAEDEKIAFMGVAVLVVLIFTAGLVGFVSQQTVLEKSLMHDLADIARGRAELFHSRVEQAIELTNRTAKRPEIIRRFVQSQADVPASRLLPVKDQLNIALLDLNGKELYQQGDSGVGKSDFEVNLPGSNPSLLRWDGGLRLHTSALVSDTTGPLGFVVIEYSLDDVYHQLYNGREIGETGEAVICMGYGDDLLCLNQLTDQPGIHKVNSMGRYGKVLPIKLAVDGKEGLGLAVDYRGNNVVAARVSLAPGLGLVCKLDTVELYTDIRHQLKNVFFLLLFLALLGGLLLKSQLRPMARRLVASEAESADKELEIRTLLGSVDEGILTFNDQCIIQAFNPAASRMFGYAAEEMPGRSIKMLVPSHLHEARECGFRRFLQHGDRRLLARPMLELPGLRSDGSIFQLELNINEMNLKGERLFVAVIRDVTERKKAEQELFAEKERLHVTLSSIGDAVITTDTEGLVTYLNPVAESMTGWASEEALGRPIAEVFCIIDEKTGEAAINPIDTVLETEAIAGLAADTTLLQRHTAKEFPVEDSAAPIRDREGRISGVVLVFHDVTESRKMAAEMTYQATHDSLTGLINRREFERRVDMALQTGKSDQREHSLLYLDLDQFKIVNDTCGHVAGDELLRQLASVLLAKLRHTDTLARLGGDEFGVLLDSCPTTAALKIAETLREAVSDFHFVWKDKTFSVGVTIGLVTFSNHGITLTDILQMADSACYVAKEKGRNRVQIYLPESQEFSSRQGQVGWVGRIRQAMEQNRFVLYAQSYSSLANVAGERRHSELLLRMRDEDNSLIPPMAFIPAAERYGLMPMLDRWVVSTAFARYASFSKQDQLLAINLSGTTLCDEAFPAFVQEQFRKYQVPPASICFEITETAAIANLTQATKLIQELRALGCHFALDDFGSGMSSFGYLKQLPVDFLKIDGNFVRDMAVDPIDRAMVESINNIGHVMGIQTIAEFVESDQVLDILREIGVDFAQGYRIEEPQVF